MTRVRKPDRPCVVCGVMIEPFHNRKTCSDECSATLRKQTQKAYAELNRATISERRKRWYADNLDRELRKGRQRYAVNRDTYGERNRLYQRARRGTDPTKYAENRDPEAIKQRARERWRRGQAARRARLRGEQS